MKGCNVHNHEQNLREFFLPTLIQCIGCEAELTTLCFLGQLRKIPLVCLGVVFLFMAAKCIYYRETAEYLILIS